MKRPAQYRRQRMLRQLHQQKVAERSEIETLRAEKEQALNEAWEQRCRAIAAERDRAAQSVPMLAKPLIEEAVKAAQARLSQQIASRIIGDPDTQAMMKAAIHRAAHMIANDPGLFNLACSGDGSIDITVLLDGDIRTCVHLPAATVCSAIPHEEISLRIL